MVRTLPKLSSRKRSPSERFQNLFDKYLEDESKPLWEGPESDSNQGGITQSLLNDFLGCKKRFELKVIKGLQERRRFNSKIEFGSMWHECEESYNNCISSNKTVVGEPWLGSLKTYCNKLLKEYRSPVDVAGIKKWFNVIKIQFPLYVEYWKGNKDDRAKIPIAQELSFKIPYKLPSGRTVYLRGKIDGINKIGKGLWQQENKTKSEIDEENIKQRLKFDMQTMIYHISCQYILDQDDFPHSSFSVFPLKGVIYNVIRRPLSGGKGSIKPREATKGNLCNLKACRESMEETGKAVKGCRKCNGHGRYGMKPAETDQEFYSRLKEDYLEKEPETYFMRWKVPITNNDVEVFKNEFLDPCLEHLCLWYDVVTGKKNIVDRGWCGLEGFINYRQPYGIWNSLMEGTSTIYDNYLATGSEVGLDRVKTLFPEL